MSRASLNKKLETIKLPEPAIVEPVRSSITPVASSITDVALPTSTAEDNRKAAGQRLTNFLWEGTQALIAASVTGAIIYTEVVGKHSESLDKAFTLIIAIYFVRMNHTKVGGIGGTDSR